MFDTSASDVWDDYNAISNEVQELTEDEVCNNEDG